MILRFVFYTDMYCHNGFVFRKLNIRHSSQHLPQNRRPLSITIAVRAGLVNTSFSVRPSVLGWSILLTFWFVRRFLDHLEILRPKLSSSAFLSTPRFFRHWNFRNPVWSRQNKCWKNESVAWVERCVDMLTFASTRHTTARNPCGMDFAHNRSGSSLRHKETLDTLTITQFVVDQRVWPARDPF